MVFKKNMVLGGNKVFGENMVFGEEKNDFGKNMCFVVK